jgi:hypothetical protein
MPPGVITFEDVIEISWENSNISLRELDAELKRTQLMPERADKEVRLERLRQYYRMDMQYRYNLLDILRKHREQASSKSR